MPNLGLERVGAGRSFFSSGKAHSFIYCRSADVYKRIKDCFSMALYRSFLFEGCLKSKYSFARAICVEEASSKEDAVGGNEVRLASEASSKIAGLALRGAKHFCLTESYGLQVQELQAAKDMEWLTGHRFFRCILKFYKEDLFFWCQIFADAVAGCVLYWKLFEMVFFDLAWGSQKGSFLVYGTRGLSW